MFLINNNKNLQFEKILVQTLYFITDQIKLNGSLEQERFWRYNLKEFVILHFEVLAVDLIAEKFTPLNI